MPEKKEIYFHVGLGKTGTTFLQQRVFPHFKNVYYLQSGHYRHFRKSIEKCQANKIFISREFDRQLQREAKRFSQHYPHAKTIIVLRRHASWIASEYKRYLKSGKNNTFDSFLDLQNDNGNWKKEDVFFYPKIKYLEKKFDHKPLVLFFKDLKKDSWGYIDKFANYMNATYSKQNINTKPKHKSYNTKQLKIIKKFNQKFMPQGPDYSDNYYIMKIQRWMRMIPRYIVLYSAPLIPNKFVDDQPLIAPEKLQKIEKNYREDWRKCVEYARQNNPL
ncbi:MAG: sulfotransferase domain-containing protein [Candidatus Marinimicrobia bacterium]|nr:sulfotransferase domain-containing protein [Candidatus Neomarinimicrobiota bacterium]